MEVDEQEEKAWESSPKRSPWVRRSGGEGKDHGKKRRLTSSHNLKTQQGGKTPPQLYLRGQFGGGQEKERGGEGTK